MAADYVPLNPRNGNGHMPFPTSRKAFNRGLPRRVGSIEDQVDDHDRRLDAVVSRLTAVESRSVATGSDPGLAVRMATIVEIADRLAGRLSRTNKRSTRSRRKLAVITDQIAAQLE
jgi:hypothetical protein